MKKEYWQELVKLTALGVLVEHSDEIAGVVYISVPKNGAPVLEPEDTSVYGKALAKRYKKYLSSGYPDVVIKYNIRNEYWSEDDCAMAMDCLSRNIADMKYYNGFKNVD